MLYQVQKENVVGTHPTHTYYPAMYQLIPHIISMYPSNKKSPDKRGKTKGILSRITSSNDDNRRRLNIKH